jgi:integrase
LRQKTLDQHRQALSLVFAVTLPNFDAEIPTFTDGRAYTHAETEQIARRQAAHNALATRIAFRGGLRASDLIELREAHELAPEPGRPWRSDLFLGLPEGVIYRTTGKGGLARSVWIPLELHEQLKLRRLETPSR